MLTGNPPYPYQCRLYQMMMAGNPPRRLSAATGAGKTSIIAIWLCVVWQQLEDGNLAAPRRLYFSIDRRIVVDQSEVTAKQIVANARNTSLWGLLPTFGEDKLVVSVLRGQRSV